MWLIACGVGVWAAVVLSTWWAVSIETERLLRRLRGVSSQLDEISSGLEDIADNVAAVRWSVEAEEVEQTQPVVAPSEQQQEQKRESVGWSI